VAVLEVRNLVKHFFSGSGEVVHAVNDVSLSIDAGGTLGLVGESGSGKTTVGRCVVGLDQPTAGSIHIARPAGPPGSKRKSQSPPSVQIVFQDAQTSLDPRMTIQRIIEEPLRLRGSEPQRRWAGLASEAVARVGLDQTVLSRRPRYLTDGEQQRVALARAVITRPQLVVLDEVTSALDPFSRRDILSLIQRLQSELQTAFMFISHDLAAVEQVSQRIAVMYLGKIVEIGPTVEVMRQPRHPYTRALLNSILSPDTGSARPRPMLSGEIPSPLQLPTGCFLASRCPVALPSCTTAPPGLWDVGSAHQAACIRAHEDDIGALLEDAARLPHARVIGTPRGPLAP
jgi:oligopeptide/dipeptide ABC transporter ATP-binding protein